MSRGVISLQMFPWMLRAIFIIGVLITLILFINAHLNAVITIFTSESSTITTRILHHPGIMVTDTLLQTTNAGIVDAAACVKFTNNDLEKAITYDTPSFAGMFTVKDGSRTVCSATFNKKRYDILRVQLDAGGPFRKAVYEKNATLPILIQEGTTQTAGTIEIIILREA